MSREFKGRDKKVHKMTKDGLVEKNLATGEESRISGRGQDFNLRQEQPDTIHLDSLQSSSNGQRNSRNSSVHQDSSMSTSTQDNDFIRDIHDIPADPTADNTNHQLSDSGIHDNASGEVAGEKPIIQDSSERLRFIEGTDSSVPSSSSKIKQSGTKYTQKFVQDEVTSKTETPPQTEDVPVDKVSDTGDLSKRKASEAGRSRLKFQDTTEPTASTENAKQRGTKYTRQFVEEAAKPSEAKHSPDAPPSAATEKPSRLRFDKNELRFDSEIPKDKKLQQAKYKTDTVNEKLETARDNLPTKREIKIKRVYDEQKGKVKRKLKFEETPLARGEKRLNPPKIVKAPVSLAKGGTKAAMKGAHGKLHQKIYQVEDENVGVKAGHLAEQIGEKGLRMTGRSVSKTYRFVKDKPYRTVAKLEKQATKANVKLSYRKALEDNPQLKSNIASRFMQKQKIKRAYAKAARDAKKAGETAKKTGSVISRAGKAVANAVKNHPAVAGTIALILLLLFFIMSMFGSCSNMASGIMSSVVSTSYVAEDADIDNAELAYTEWETDLQMEVNGAESDNPGYDEYRYNIGDISHDPFEIMAYLTSKYQDFNFSDVQTDLRQIFEEQYQLTLEPEVEIRYRTEIRTDTWTDDEGNTHHDTYTVEVPYEWHILNINLTANSFSDVIMPKLNAEQLEMFEIYMQTKGNRQYLINPFNFNWIPYVSDYYGWRVHPISGAKDYHKGIDIAVAEGTEILAGHDGKVTQAGNAGDYGLIVVIEGENALISKYAHCSQLLVSVGQEVKKGDVIAKVGSTGNSTGPHLHLEVIKGGQYLNPIFFGETGDDGSGRVPPGSPGGVEFPEYPGEPIGDGSYAALIAEAEKHLGKKYVFGANGPDNFDCSSFVCWALDKSGVKPMGRTTAQGLYNMCTPVSLADAKPGDLIFFTGTYSSPSACSHVGIYVGNGMMLHCGDPVQYTSINSSYWQSHFYAFGRY